MTPRESLYKRNRFPSAIIQHAVWLYYRFNLSHRDIEDILARWSVLVTRELSGGLIVGDPDQPGAGRAHVGTLYVKSPTH